ncbi:MAG: type II toxin-antitoxin system VapC family toxin [Armatimonadota bacterium]|nr:type II toxin-antitoxin system VapC family toxin [Armatimonadota bacterium]
MGILIDSSVFIAAERGRVALAEYIRGREHEPVAISAITASELLHGVHRARDPRQRTRRAQFVEAILARLPVVEFDLETARVHAQLWADLLDRGQAVGAHDLIIGATAIAMDVQVATVNAGDFERIPGLQVQIWGA